MTKAFLSFCLIVTGIGSAAPGFASDAAPEKQAVVVNFSETVANIEFESQEFPPSPLKSVKSPPPASSGTLWYGRIKRRLPDDPRVYSRREIPFAAAYTNGMPITFWCDLNLNGELSDEKPIKLYHYPNPSGSRAALVNIGWTAKLGGESIPVSWKIRIVLQPFAFPDTLPRYRLQWVLAKTGSVTIDGQKRTAFLYDGSSDGLYSKDFGDGLFIDVDGDGEITVDTTSPEFLPFRVPSQVGKTILETVRVEPRGSQVELSGLPGQSEYHQAAIGDPAPDFTFEALDGRQVRLSAYRGRPVVVYFWASWCAACAALAPDLRAVYDRLHPRGLEILSIAFDTDRAKLDAFEAKHHEPWPVSYLGRGFWENPIGRLYGVSAAGAAYLVDAEGKCIGLYYDFKDLEENAGALFPGGEKQVGSAR